MTAALTKSTGLGALVQQHEVVGHRHLRHRALDDQPHPQLFARLRGDRRQAELHVLGADDLDGPHALGWAARAVSRPVSGCRAGFAVDGGFGGRGGRRRERCTSMIERISVVHESASSCPESRTLDLRIPAFREFGTACQAGHSSVSGMVAAAMETHQYSTLTCEPAGIHLKRRRVEQTAALDHRAAAFPGTARRRTPCRGSSFANSRARDVRLRFSSQMPSQGKSARRQT